VLSPDGTTIDHPFEVVQRTGTPVLNQQVVLTEPNGRRHSLRLDTAPLLSADGAFAGTVTAITDISKQLELEEHLRAHKTILASISENVPGIVYQFEITPEQSQRFLFVSESIVDLLGISAESVANDARALTGRVHPEDRESYKKRLANSYARLETFNNRVRLISTSGEARWFESHTTPRRLPDGTVQWTGVSMDITDQVEKDERLKQSERNLRSLFEHSTYGIILADDDNHVVDCNQTASDLLGYTQEELLGMHAARLIPAEAIDAQPLEQTMERARRLNEPMEFDGPFIRKDGTRFDAIIRMRFLDHLPEGATHIVSFNDVTARRSAEREVRSLLHEKELLLGELHHRVKNDLSLVQAFASLQMEQTSNQETRHALEEMIQRISVMARVYEALQGSSGIEDVRLDTLLKSTVASLQDTFVPAHVGIVLKTESVSVPKEVAVSAGIIVNELVTNSVKYGFPNEQPGEIEVRLVETNTVRIVVEDNGRGFEKETLQEADYGFGLTVVNALASQHGGRLQAGRGSSGGAQVIVEIENKGTIGANPGGTASSSQ
jgi:PAS domain S-box-containing protein